MKTRVTTTPRLRPAAVVMNMYYTGLGIARSLGERGVPVIGLSAQSRVYGNYTRFAEIRMCPDSREQPEHLLRFLLELGKQLGRNSILFPTRDDDVSFLDRYRGELKTLFHLVVPPSAPLGACLDKWETYQYALRSGVLSPRSWKVESRGDVARASGEVQFPCVLKPLRSSDWRQAGNWRLVQGRKAIAIETADELAAEYDVVAQGNNRALIQELVPGDDTNLLIAACYVNAASNVVAGFTAHKLAQSPAGFGTGYVVETADEPEILVLAGRLLKGMCFTGIAEVEFKRDGREYKLIEVNARPWDQHRLGNAEGVDLIYLAYCEHAGEPIAVTPAASSPVKWVADDVFLMEWLRSSRNWRGLVRLWRLSRGRRIYAIWSVRDPLPFAVYLASKLLVELPLAVLRRIGSITRRDAGARLLPGKGPL